MKQILPTKTPTRLTTEHLLDVNSPCEASECQAPSAQAAGHRERRDFCYVAPPTTGLTEGMNAANGEWNGNCQLELNNESTFCIVEMCRNFENVLSIKINTLLHDARIISYHGHSLRKIHPKRTPEFFTKYNHQIDVNFIVEIFRSKKSERNHTLAFVMILPIGSMYTFTINLVVNAGKYTIHGSYGLWLMFTSKIALLGSLALQNHQARCSPFGCAAKGTARAKHAEAASNTTCTQHILPLAAYKAQSMSLTKLLIQAFLMNVFWILVYSSVSETNSRDFKAIYFR